MAAMRVSGRMILDVLLYVKERHILLCILHSYTGIQVCSSKFNFLMTGQERTKSTSALKFFLCSQLSATKDVMYNFVFKSLDNILMENGTVFVIKQHKSRSTHIAFRLHKSGAVISQLQIKV